MPCPNCGNRFGYAHGPLGVCASCGQSRPLSAWGDPPRRKVTVHQRGTHGYKRREQRAVGTSGSTHESEHAIGYEVLGRGLKRNHSALARDIENRAPAYQEHKPDHRDHIGTGTHSDYRGTGMSSTDYRNMQRTAMEEGRPDNAVQLNQLEYAHQPGFQRDIPGRLKADRSFQTMADDMEEVAYWSEHQSRIKRARVDELQRAEMNLARRTARTGRYPSRSEELAEMRRLGMIVGAEPDALPASMPAPSHSTDIHGIPQDGDCLFHAIRSRLHFHSNGAMPDLSVHELRARAVGFLRYDPDFHATGLATHAYLDAMARPGTWGGGPEIMALAQIFGICICVIAPTYTIAFNEQSRERTITIYYYGVGHYSTGPTGPF